MHQCMPLHLVLVDLLSSNSIRIIMKNIFLLFVVFSLCNAAPAPVPAPAPKADPSLLYATPLVAAPAAVSYSTVYKAPPSYPVYTPYVYNLGYASAYPYSIHPSYYII